MADKEGGAMSYSDKDFIEHLRDQADHLHSTPKQEGERQAMYAYRLQSALSLVHAADLIEKLMKKSDGWGEAIAATARLNAEHMQKIAIAERIIACFEYHRKGFVVCEQCRHENDVSDLDIYHLTEEWRDTLRAGRKVSYTDIDSYFFVRTKQERSDPQ